MTAKEHTADHLTFADEYSVKTIELLPCRYYIVCRVVEREKAKDREIVMRG